MNIQHSKWNEYIFDTGMMSPLMFSVLLIEEVLQNTDFCVHNFFGDVVIFCKLSSNRYCFKQTSPKRFTPLLALDKKIQQTDEKNF